MARKSTQIRINEIFLDACDVPSVELDQFLSDACDGDSEVRIEVERLLEADKEFRSGNQVLPDPPLKGFLNEIQKVADDIDSQLLLSARTTQPLECEQCGAKIGYLEPEQPIVCFLCGGVTRSFKIVESDIYADVAKLKIEAGKRFIVQEVIGEGSYGVVYKAWDSRLEREVALKIPKGKLVSRKLFVREARAASQLNHNNIVIVYDVNNSDDFAFIVSDYIAGMSLHRWRKTHSLSVRKSCELCRTIILAMDHAHSKDVIHRDLKPSNIMMTDSGEPKVLDFGLSKSLSAPNDSLVTPGAPIGTPAFMSPEQATGKAELITATSDVYSLGVILYQLLTGCLPFTGEDIFEAICHDDPKPIQTFNSKLPQALNAIVMTAMSKKPADRYPTARAFADDLQRFIDGRRVDAYPKLDRRVVLATAKKWAITAVVAGLIATATVFAYSAWSEYRLNNPLTKVVVDASVPDAELRWCRYDEETGELDVDDPTTGKAGQALNLTPGFYKVYATGNGITNELFRTVPNEYDVTIMFPGVMLNHRSWDVQTSPVQLAKIQILDPRNTIIAEAFEDAVYVEGGKLTTGEYPDIGSLFQNIEYQLGDFKVTRKEFGINDVKRAFPKMLDRKLNFEIAVAFAEKMGASLPTIEEYFFIEQQGIELDNLTDGLKEWTESPLHKAHVTIGGTKRVYGSDLDQRWVVDSTDELHDLGRDFQLISHPKFVNPVPSLQPVENSGFRLVWRY